MENNRNYPLVSVYVLTYNSSKTVLETLESIKAQTYRNIELIISDDASKDDTVEICRQWLAENEKCFVKAQMLTVPTNTGTVRNGNRAAKAGSGEWGQCIAADDRMLPNCITDNVNYITKYPDTEFLFSKMQFIGNGDSTVGRYWGNCTRLFENLNYQELEILSCCVCFLGTPSCFRRSMTFFEMGCYDESYVLLEDHPLFIKAFQEKRVIRFMPTFTVEYRLSASSVGQNTPSPTYKKDKDLCYEKRLQRLYELSRFSRLYIITLRRLSQSPSLYNHFIHMLNVFNPFLWKKMKIMKIYEQHKRLDNVI